MHLISRPTGVWRTFPAFTNFEGAGAVVVHLRCHGMKFFSADELQVFIRHLRILRSNPSTWHEMS